MGIWAQNKLAADKGMLSDADLRKLTWKEVAGTAKIIAQLRIMALPFMMIIVGALVMVNAEPWRLWLFGGTAVVVAGIVIHDFLWLRKNRLDWWHVPYLMGVVILLHSAMIIVTGGVESPFLVLWMVMGLVPAVAFGRLKPFLAMAAIPLSFLWLLTIGTVSGLVPDLSTSLWGPELGFGRNEAYVFIQAGIFTLATSLAGAVILYMRRAVEGAVRAAVTTRQKLIDSISERNRELMNLSGELAHELKNPLASVHGLTDIVVRQLPIESKEKERLEVVLGAVRRMESILDQFLNFSRPLTGLSLQKVRPAELLADLVMLHDAMAHKHGIELKGTPDHTPPLYCDPRKINGALVNLVQNALEATPRGGKVVFSCWQEKADWVSFGVEDTGHGLSAQVRARLFEPGVTTKKDGTGLGLVIARAIAEQHGGTLQLTDRDGGGCRAVLTVPVTPPLKEHRKDAPQTKHPAIAAKTEPEVGAQV